MKVDDPQLSWVHLVIHCVVCVNLLFRKFVGCGGPKLTGDASGQGVFRLQTSDFRDIYLNRIAEKVNQYLSGCVPVDEKYGT